MSKLAPLPITTRATARVSTIAIASLLSAACFRYNPASRPDGEAQDASASDGSAMDSSTDASGAIDAAMDSMTEDRAASTDSASESSADATVVTDVVVEADSTAPADARSDACVVADASGPDSGALIAAGDCAVNNGGCSTFARCQPLCGGLRRCECATGLQLGADGTSCSGLVLVSKTSIATAGTNFDTASFDVSISRTGRFVAFVSVVESVLRTQRCFSADSANETLTEISATRDAMGREQRPEQCFSPLVTEDGRRALFVARGLHPADPVAPPMWGASIVATTPWPYFRDNSGTPTRVDVWQHGMPEQNWREGFNNFRFGRDGQHMAFSTRSNPDPTRMPGDSMDFYSASIPIQPFEPLYENVNTDRSIAPFFSGVSNSRDMDLAGDSVTLLFGTARRINGETHPGTDIFARRIGSTGTTTPTINVTPDPGGSGDSRFPTGSLDGSTVCFVSNSPGVGVTAGATEYVLSVRRGGPAAFYRLNVPVPPSGALASSVSDDGRWLVLATNAAFAIAGQPTDDNAALDYYLFDISDPSMPRPVRRLNLLRNNTQPLIAHAGGAQVRLAGDGSSAVFTTTQQLVPEDNNGGGSDVYLRVFR